MVESYISRVMNSAFLRDNRGIGTVGCTAYMRCAVKLVPSARYGIFKNDHDWGYDGLDLILFSTCVACRRAVGYGQDQIPGKISGNTPTISDGHGYKRKAGEEEGRRGE